MEQARSTACRNILRQDGLALVMYVQEMGAYPPLAQRGTTLLCFDRLYPYCQVNWTNTSWNCPTYLANKGIISHERVETNSTGISYAYNDMGILTGWPDCPRSIFQQQLGLGHLPPDSKREVKVAAPSEMYAFGDARSVRVGQNIAGAIKMSPWIFSAHTYLGDGAEAPAPHAGGYNMLFCDGHASLIKRSDYLYPPRGASHWNNDNQPHPEAWAPTNFWAVQN